MSAASAREVAIQHGSGRGDMPLSEAEALTYFEQAGYFLLARSPQHAAWRPDPRVAR